MYGEEPSDAGTGAEENPREGGAKSDEEEAYETNRPRARYGDDTSAE